MPQFGQVWDMLNQTGLLLKPPSSADNPLADLDVDRIIMVGYSQSAAYQVTHANSFYSDAMTPGGAPIIYGYFISAGGDNAKHVTGPTATTPESPVRNHGRYVSQMARAVKQSEKEGFLLRDDAATQRRDAAHSDVGKK